MKLSVYSLRKILFQGEAELLNCKTMVGEITVLNNHIPLIGVIEPGIIKVVGNDKKERFFPVKSGFLEIREGNEARALVEEQL